MGVDLGKIDAMVQQAAEKANQVTDFVKPFYYTVKFGVNNLRLCPPWTEEGPTANQYARELFVHWVNKIPYLCPVKTPHAGGTECPLCEHVSQLYKTEDPEDAVLAQEYRAQRTFYSNVVDYSDPVVRKSDLQQWNSDNAGKECPFTVGQTKVQVWRYGVTVNNYLMNFFNAGRVDITDPKTGFKLLVTRTKVHAKKSDYSVMLDPKGPSAFDFQGSLVNLDTIMKTRKLDELQKALNGISMTSPQLPTSETTVVGRRSLSTGNGPVQAMSSEAMALMDDIKNIT